MKGTMSENGFPQPTEEGSLINNNKYPLNIVSDNFSLYYSDFLQNPPKKRLTLLRHLLILALVFFPLV
jgi:hypothetical protein